MKKLGLRLWLSMVLIGLTGQFAWTIENMYFNVFLYNTVSTVINVSYSSMSAEISKLRKEGILNSRKNEFELL